MVTISSHKLKPWDRFAVAGGLQGTNSKGPGGFLGHFDILKPFFKPISRQTDLVFKREEGIPDMLSRDLSALTHPGQESNSSL